MAKVTSEKLSYLLGFVSIMLLTNFTTGHSQNLVRNGDFEKVKKPLIDLGIYSNLYHSLGWINPNKASPDFYNLNPESKERFYFEAGTIEPYSGNCMAGIGFFNNDNFEYIQTKLSKKLKANQLYCLSASFCLGKKYPFGLESIGFTLTKSKIKSKGKQIIKTEEKNFFIDRRLSNNTLNWINLKSIYKANGDELFLTIGNFNEKLKYIYVGEKKKEKKNMSISVYYYIDDVSLNEIKDSAECVCQTKVIETIKKDSVGTLVANYDKALSEKLVIPNIQFESNKSILLPLSNLELDKLADYLLRNGKYAIEIYGNTDNVGREKDNISLSKQRADAVSNYLLQKGVSKSRMRTFGFGSRFPISSNSDEKGRALNRRVEFKLFK